MKGNAICLPVLQVGLPPLAIPQYGSFELQLVSLACIRQLLFILFTQLLFGCYEND